jgi:hypothetical protein
MRISEMSFVKNMLPHPVKKNIKRCIWAVKGSRKSLPHFIIIGAAKAGTTSLYTYLIQHSQILEATHKEVHFFDVKYQNGVIFYRSHFPLRAKMKQGVITGEASPGYLFHPHVPRRIFQLLPNVKLIVLLRDPVDRAISHYFHSVREDGELLPIEEAFRNEEKILAEELIKMQKDESYYSEIYRTRSYKRRGVYVDQLTNYLNYFSINQILILKSEDLFSDPLKLLSGVFAFLNIDSSFLPNDLTPKNVGDFPTEVSPLVYEELANYFAPHNERLYQFLGHDFGWKTPTDRLNPVGPQD